MIFNRHQRGWLMVAAIAISIALVLMLVPHGHAGDGGDWMTILPVLFVGIISPLSLLPRLANEYTSRVSDAPVLPTLFQRPPPLTLA